MSKSELVTIADQFATRLQWLHSTGKHLEDPELYKRVASELLHVSNLIDEKILNKVNKKYDYNG
tara:strand:- start:7450 stop:7641 length:192 start_codon:yes stop_codon:yes gene_type:complete